MKNDKKNAVRWKFSEETMNHFGLNLDDLRPKFESISPVIWQNYIENNKINAYQHNILKKEQFFKFIYKQ